MTSKVPTAISTAIISMLAPYGAVTPAQIERLVSDKPQIINAPLDQLLTITDTARILKVTRPTIYKLIRENKLKSITISERQRITRSSIENLFGGAE